MNGATGTYYEWSDGNTITGGATATHSFTGLTANTTYKIKVRARYSNNGVDTYTGWVSKTVTTEAVGA